MIFFDTETCGLHGMAVLIQWAEDDGPIHLHSVWTQPASETLELIEKFANDTVVGFNLAFDWFHLCKLHTIFSLLPDKSIEPVDHIDTIAELEPYGRDGLCVKPRGAHDIMLHARKGPYQSTMDRGDIRIRRVPTALAWQLAAELEKRIPLSDVLFARKKEKSQKWQVFDIMDEDDEMNPNFKDVVLKFHPSSALKALATDALKLPVDSVLLFADVEVDHKHRPEEYGYAPFARAVGNRHDWKGAWPEKIKHHINHWSHYDLARTYAEKDVQYTRDLYRHFGSPPANDDDSILACMVAAVRWKGYREDVQGLQKLKDATLASKTKTLPNGKEFTIPTAPAQARYYVTEHMDATERLIVADSTKKVLLEEIAKWKRDCPDCISEDEVAAQRVVVSMERKGDTNNALIPKKPCARCNGKQEIVHPAALRATEILEARQANYEADLYDKFILAGRFHASFVVIGTLSSRMAGTDGLNAQGVKKTKTVRGCFPLAWPGHTLCGGDFSGFEVTLAEACYSDPDLRKDLQSKRPCFLCRGTKEVPPHECTNTDKCEGCNGSGQCKGCGGSGLNSTKIHALFGVHVFPDMTYEEILATEGTKDDRYTRCKQAVFAMFYGGEGFTLKDRLGVDIETAEKAYDAFCKRYKQVGVARKKVFDMFCSMRQPGGIGSKVEWSDPADYIESMFGFRRYFTLENSICKALYELSNRPPPDWAKIKIKVNRRERVQTAMGAVQSALYAAAFGLQASNMRAAANHVIQSAGAQVTKKVQVAIWSHQPTGVHEWIVQPFNIHDEIQCPVKPGHEEAVKKTVDSVVESIRPKVPLIRMDWSIGLNSWADK